jgi:hypothetical protein
MIVWVVWLANNKVTRERGSTDSAVLRIDSIGVIPDPAAMQQ